MNSPPVTIGMPVYNGALHIAQAIDALLNQTWTDFHLVIYDNASTDRTPEICAEYAARDSRIRVIRHERTISAIDNFITVAELADTPYFCWAAHDDLHHADFLRTLVELLDNRPTAGLAACGCIELDPDGTPRRRCEATESLIRVTNEDACARLVAYLRHSPCSAIYGLFRTDALKQHLNILRNGPVFGADLVFLAAFLAHHDLAFAPEPLLMLRAGGGSHRPDQFTSAAHLLRELWNFHSSLGRAIAGFDSPLGRLRLYIARWRLLHRYLMWQPMRMMLAHYICESLPMLAAVRDRCVAHGFAFRRLQRRLLHMPRNTRVILFGAGKHTRRVLRALQHAMHSRATIVAVCDDNAASLPPLPNNISLVHPADVAPDACDLVLISSDTYERMLYVRARSLFAPSIPIWCLYDLGLEKSEEHVVEHAGLRATNLHYKCSAAA